jgi:hypothetical protein
MAVTCWVRMPHAVGVAKQGPLRPADYWTAQLCGCFPSAMVTAVVLGQPGVGGLGAAKAHAAVQVAGGAGASRCLHEQHVVVSMWTVQPGLWWQSVLDAFLPHDRRRVRCTYQHMLHACNASDSRTSLQNYMRHADHGSPGLRSASPLQPLHDGIDATRKTVFGCKRR